VRQWNLLPNHEIWHHCLWTAYFRVTRCVTILFSSNKLLKLKYIHHQFFFLKFLTKKSRCVLRARASYRPGNTVLLKTFTPWSLFLVSIFGSCLVKARVGGPVARGIHCCPPFFLYFLCPTHAPILRRKCVCKYTHIWQHSDYIWITVATK
jgi:hypothetical protein